VSRILTWTLRLRLCPRLPPSLIPNALLDPSTSRQYGWCFRSRCGRKCPSISPPAERALMIIINPRFHRIWVGVRCGSVDGFYVLGGTGKGIYRASQRLVNWICWIWSGRYCCLGTTLKGFVHTNRSVMINNACAFATTHGKNFTSESTNIHARQEKRWNCLTMRTRTRHLQTYAR
jgi:hypothetical protein